MGPAASCRTHRAGTVTTAPDAGREVGTVDTLVYIGGAVLFFALIMVSIALHEIGHMVPAKLFGVKVTEYFVGFGKTLASWRRGETEYGFKLLPLGGYVRLVGMFPPDRENRVRSGSSNPIAGLIDASRDAEWAEISPEDDGRLFYQKKTWQKLIVMACGPLTNIVLAFFILWGVTGLYGVYESQPVVSRVDECIIPAEETGRPCRPGDPETPAHAMGLQPGDRIVDFNGTPIVEWKQMQTLIRANLDQPATITVERGGERVVLPTVDTLINEVPDLDSPSRTVQAGFLGVAPTSERVTGGPGMVAEQMGDMTVKTFHALGRFPVMVYDTAADLVTGRERDPYGPMSIVGASRAAGEISSTDQISAGDKVASFVSLIGSVNLFVGLFNFVPLLPLDGGHILGAIIEWIRRQGARLFSRPDPGHLDTAKFLPLTYAVFAFITLSGVILIAADLISPIRLFG